MKELQRGRARAGAECARIRRIGQRSRAASTGPRPRGRGMKSTRTEHTGLLGASTGPRPRGRGMYRIIIRRPTRQYRFNGAAPARARNVIGLAADTSTSWRLQRGRARAGAEWGRAGVNVASEQWLQRGRARAGAEWDSNPTTANPILWLQRGRARAGAE